jgi:hypothetical protein
MRPENGKEFLQTIAARKLDCGVGGFAAPLAESLWLSGRLLRVRGFASVAAEPQDNLYSSGKPEAFRKECGKAALAMFLRY